MRGLLRGIGSENMFFGQLFHYITVRRSFNLFFLLSCNTQHVYRLSVWRHLDCTLLVQWFSPFFCYRECRKEWGEVKITDCNVRWCVFRLVASSQSWEELLPPSAGITEQCGHICGKISVPGDEKRIQKGPLRPVFLSHHQETSPVTKSVRLYQRIGEYRLWL